MKLINKFDCYESALIKICFADLDIIQGLQVSTDIEFQEFCELIDPPIDTITSTVNYLNDKNEWIQVLDQLDWFNALEHHKFVKYARRDPLLIFNLRVIEKIDSDKPLTTMKPLQSCSALVECNEQAICNEKATVLVMDNLQEQILKAKSQLVNRGEHVQQFKVLQTRKKLSIQWENEFLNELIERVTKPKIEKFDKQKMIDSNLSKKMLHQELLSKRDVCLVFVDSDDIAESPLFRELKKRHGQFVEKRNLMEDKNLVNEEFLIIEPSEVVIEKKRSGWFGGWFGF